VLFSKIPAGPGVSWWVRERMLANVVAFTRPGHSSIMVATQKIHVGMIHARKTVTVTAEDDQFTLAIDGETVGVVPAPPPGKSTDTSSTQLGERSS
jgi:hypothetical protein